jgi:replicative DNA helicase
MTPKLDKKLLSIILKNQKCAIEATEKTSPDYYHSSVRKYFEAVVHYLKDPSIKALPTRDMIEDFFGNEPIDEDLYTTLLCEDTSINEFGWLMEKVKLRYNDSLQGKVIGELHAIKSEPLTRERIEKINNTLKKSVTEVDAIYRQAVYKEGTLRDSATERAKAYVRVRDNPSLAQGVLSGFTTFDRITNGLHPGELMIIAANTGHGKSIVMHNYAVNAYLGGNNPFADPSSWDSSKGKNVLYFSLEMPKEVQERRIDSCIAGIYSNQIRDGLLSEEDEGKYLQVLDFQEAYEKHIYVVDMPKNVTPRDVELKYLEVCDLGFQPDLVVVDYLGIMGPNDTSGQDWQDLRIISAELHEFARIYEVPVLTASQVNRTKDGTERYHTDRIARSGGIPDNANVILQIASRPDEEARSDMVVYIIKMRDGEKGHFTLTKDFGRMRVVDIVDDHFMDDELEDLV